MSVSRRRFVAATLGMLAAGCAERQTARSSRPGPLWPDPLDRPRPTGSNEFVRPAHEVRPKTPWPETPPGRIVAIGRDRWAKDRPIPARLNRMGGIRRITVHHEGWTPVWFDDADSTAERLESIRRSHLNRMRAGDIGYHFVIDRAGRLWSGRDLGYQGAHVKEHNAHNLGIMVLGNFDLQRPSRAQITTLQGTLASFMRRYRVPVARLHTHRELNPTTCPGDHLQAGVAHLRGSGRLG